MDRKTYSLHVGDSSSESFYSDADRLANELLAAAHHHVGTLVDEYCLYHAQVDTERTQSEEHVLELLTLGVLWHQYAAVAAGTPWLVIRALNKLVLLRHKGGLVKSTADRLRGVLLTLFCGDGKRTGATQEPFTAQQLGRLLAWLSAVGEYRQEAIRLRSWHTFLLTKSGKQAAEAARAVANLTGWFTQRSLQVLGRYTCGVEGYLQDNYKRKRWREDILFCGRQRVEYHLNMVGAELLNRAFRADYIGSRHTELLLPGCMRAKNMEECKAVENTLGWRCVGCTTACRVHQLTCLGKKMGFSVYIASHESEVLAHGGAEALKQQQAGVVGVACAPNLIAGGWKLQTHGIPAQCVLLECSGCRKHWHSVGQPTDLNMQRLLTVIRKSEPAGKVIGE